ncbi:head maturation protease, ClpP-related [Aliihoeflea sp. 40Bstr573]|uniref:head maturation protease, ClpP-related n=1 Tax=Aliihoeflea sp. 40Bstr573 TaxID=2696467 RepID=UPI002094F94E|nr:head maturation protease, ClpP-related [Aliihoeflea sp. 40Bstr573]MCO6386358.1 Clp protease ClpP [Aliihoeflea sp. 40Bstr573]
MSLRNLPEVRAFQKPEWLNFDAPHENVEAFDPAVVSASGDDETTITIYGQIGLDPFTAVDNTERRIAAALRAIGNREVTVSINSPGGSFLSGLAIYNLLRAHPAKVTVQVIAMAGSAASVIAMAGDDIQMADGSFIMVHKASAISMGNEFDMQDAAELLAEVDASMAEVYAARAGVDRKIAASWMERRRGDGTMFSASSAIQHGLADRKLNASAIKVKAEAPKIVPHERVLENALMAAANMSPQQAKAFVAEMKTGTRDAPVITVTRDADDLRAAIEQLRSTINA